MFFNSKHFNQDITMSRILELTAFNFFLSNGQQAIMQQIVKIELEKEILRLKNMILQCNNRHDNSRIMPREARIK